MLAENDDSNYFSPVKKIRTWISFTFNRKRSWKIYLCSKNPFRKETTVTSHLPSSLHIGPQIICWKTQRVMNYPFARNSEAHPYCVMIGPDKQEFAKRKGQLKPIVDAYWWDSQEGHNHIYIYIYIYIYIKGNWQEPCISHLPHDSLPDRAMEESLSTDFMTLV